MAGNRKSLSKRRRFAVFTRDYWTCQYCGRSAPDVTLEIDHIHPASKGGDDSDENLITACFDCNRGKSAHVIPERRVGMVGSEQLAQAKAVLQFKKAMAKIKQDLENFHADRIGELLWGECEVPSKSSIQSLRNFESRGLTWEKMEELASYVGSKMYDRADDDIWRYFCGCCHKVLKGQSQ